MRICISLQITMYRDDHDQGQAVLLLPRLGIKSASKDLGLTLEKEDT